jgi:hypothetical protein
MCKPGIVELASSASTLNIIRLFFKEEKMWILLQEVASTPRHYVLELHGLYSFFCNDIFSGIPIKVECHSGVGSFGFSLKEKAGYQELYLNHKGGHFKNLFRAIVKNVVQREICDLSELPCE